MEGTSRSLRLLVVALVFLCTLPSSVAAREFVCWPVAAGDTASGLARRLTGKADAAYGLAFQIRDPARRMFVPKSHYRRLQPGWQACVAQGPVPKTPVVHAPEVTLAAWTAVAPDEPIAMTLQALASAPLTLARADRMRTGVPLVSTIGAALLILLLWGAAGSLAPRSIPPSVRRAGENFVAVFTRPLIDESSGAPPIQTRLRFRRRKQELEIFLAPGPGHRYPNLADHKTNVEYDLDRVISVLGNYVLSRPPRAAGKWVVVTIRPARGLAIGSSELQERGLVSAPTFGSVLFRAADFRKRTSKGSGDEVPGVIK